MTAMAMELIECGTIAKEEEGERMELASSGGRPRRPKKYSWVMN